MHGHEEETVKVVRRRLEEATGVLKAAEHGVVGETARREREAAAAQREREAAAARREREVEAARAPRKKYVPYARAWQ